MANTLVRTLRRMLTTLLWLISIVIIIFVVFLSVLKLTLPYWTEDKEHMTSLVEEQIGGDFEYQTLEVDWTQFKPKIFITGAEWTDEQQQMSYRSARTQIVLNFWESLIKGYLVAEKIELNQVTAEITLSLLEDQNRRYSVDPELFLKRYPELINQESIRVSNLSVTLNKKMGDYGASLEKDNTVARKIEVQNFSFKKLEDQRQLVVNFQSDFASQVTFIAESTGMPFSKQGELKLYGLFTDFDLVDSADFFNLPQGIPVDVADSEFWLQYQGTIPQSGRLLFNAESTDSKVASLDAEINYLHDDNIAIFSSDKFQVIERDSSGALTEYDSYFKAVRNKKPAGDIRWTLEAENTPIGYFVSLALPFMPDTLYEIMDKTHPQGDLVYLDIEAEQKDTKLYPLYGSAIIENFQSKSSDISPEVLLQTISIKDEADGWRVDLDGKDSQLIWPGVTKGTIPVEHLSVSSLLNFNSDNPVITIDKFELSNSDVNVNGSGLATIKDNDVELSIYAEASNINIAELEHYWIRSEMDEETLEFLDSALIKGTIPFARFVWRGGYDAFPYQNNEGVFEIQASLKDSLVLFDDEWPEVSGLNADVNINNNQLFLTATSGNALGNDIGRVDGVIESLFTEGSILKLDINNKIRFEPYRKLFLNSPLQEWLGSDVLDMTFTGALDNSIALIIPLSENSPDSTFDGSITYNGQSIKLAKYPVGVDNLTGVLRYSEKGAFSESIKGDLWGSPVTLDIRVDEYTDNDDLITLNASSSFDLAKAMALFEIDLPLKVSGNSAVNLHYRKDAKNDASMIVRSDLKGTSIEGPSWLSKAKDDSASFLTTIYKAGEIINSRFIYRNTVSSQLSFSADNPSDINGVIALGDLATQSIKTPQSGVAIEGFFAEIHSDEWLNSLQVKKEGDFYWPEWIDHISVKAALFTVAGQTLHDIEFSDSLLEDESVRFNVVAKEGKGNLTLYTDGRKHVTVDKLDIELKPFSSLSDSEVNINKASLDNWQLECLSCKINGIDTGQLTLVSRLKDDSIILKGDSRIEGQLSAYLEGNWTGNHSEVNITFNTQNTGALLNRWGYGDGVKETQAKGVIKLNWSGGFHDIALKNLNGNIDLETSQGAVKELSDRQARVFSLFSLQSIRRRLSLDFSDLFEEGFFYDKIKGVFTIKNGVVRSDDVFIDGAAADVRVKGSINLVKQTVNQNVTVIPKLGSSLPVLAGWAIEPTTGLIMLLVNQIFEPVIDVVVSIEYKITGDLSDPKVVEVSKKSKEVAVPDDQEEDESTESNLQPTDGDSK